MFETTKTLQASVTKTATFSSATVDLGSDFAASDLGVATRVRVPVTAIVTNDLDETYSFKLEESADDVSWSDASKSVPATATGTLEFGAFVTMRYIRLTVTIDGTTPSITYSGTAAPQTDAASEQDVDHTTDSRLSIIDFKGHVRVAETADYVTSDDRFAVVGSARIIDGKWQEKIRLNTGTEYTFVFRNTKNQVTKAETITL